MWLYLLAAPTGIVPWQPNLNQIAYRTGPIFFPFQFVLNLDLQPLLNTREVQHATASLTRPYMRNRPDVFLTDEAFVESFPDIFMYGPAEILRDRSLHDQGGRN
jgi:hypothetical protein